MQEREEAKTKKKKEEEEEIAAVAADEEVTARRQPKIRRFWKRRYDNHAIFCVCSPANLFLLLLVFEGEEGGQHGRGGGRGGGVATLAFDEEAQGKEAAAEEEGAHNKDC